jgi:hypothetical protein
MVKKQLSRSDYAKPVIVEIAVQAEVGFAASSDQFEDIGEGKADDEF